MSELPYSGAELYAALSLSAKARLAAKLLAERSGKLPHVGEVQAQIEAIEPGLTEHMDEDVLQRIIRRGIRRAESNWPASFGRTKCP